MENKPDNFLDNFEEISIEKKDDFNRLFKKLKRVRPKQLDKLFKDAHHDSFERIECLNCANCCKTTGPLFTNNDIDRLSKRFKLSTSKFIDMYLRKDEDGDWVLQTTPCPFLLEDNYCSVYEDRPKACKTYPHTDQNGMRPILDLTLKNAEVCPAVQDILLNIEKII